VLAFLAAGDLSNWKEDAMKIKRLVAIGIAGSVCAVPAAKAVADNVAHQSAPTGLVQVVRDSTRDFRDVNRAIAAGYNSMGSCVSGPQEGAMGIHFANNALVQDPALHADHPELLIYEQKDNQLRLVGVEYLVLADPWNAANPAPPVLLGQHFQYVSSPNRYGLPAFYELHVWAWMNNERGTFVDWNPSVSCDEYTGEAGSTSHTTAH
jgi:hypothetical protein